MSANKIEMITSFIKEMANGRQGSSTSEDDTSSRMSDKAIIDFLL